MTLKLNPFPSVAIPQAPTLRLASAVQGMYPGLDSGQVTACVVKTLIHIKERGVELSGDFAVQKKPSGGVLTCEDSSGRVHVVVVFKVVDRQLSVGSLNFPVIQNLDPDARKVLMEIMNLRRRTHRLFNS